MIVDTSAVLALLCRVSDARRFEDAIVEAGPLRMLVVALLEAAMVVEGRGGTAAEHELDVLLETAEVEFVPLTLEHAIAARHAWRRFGKGNHPAAPNIGDCFAYALAKATGETLLLKEDDFALTDIEAA